jgi:hypothetical protein
MYAHNKITSLRLSTVYEIVPAMKHKSKTFSQPDMPIEVKQFCSIGLILSAYIRNTYGTSCQKHHRLFAANMKIVVVC